MNRKIFPLALFLILGFITIYTFMSLRQANEGYAEGIMKKRHETDVSFSKDNDSPLTEDQKKTFTALSYFPVSEKYRIEANFVQNPEQRIIKMAITDGSQREYFVFGTATFLIDSKRLKLTVYKPTDPDKEYYFIPFYDKTSGDSSYGGGRYVEPEMHEQGRMVIDFNIAYNPYCAYNHKYRCPIPPSENNLDVAILAGEKIPEFVK